MVLGLLFMKTTINIKEYSELDLTDYLSDGKQEVRMQVYGLTTGLTTTWLSYDGYKDKPLGI